MNLEELRSVQSTERTKDSLQQLRPSFYRDVGEYIAALESKRDRKAAEAADPFASPEVTRLTDEIDTAKNVVEAVYERRMGKLVKQASLAAAGMPADDEGLTAEEQALFDDLVSRIESNKDHVLSVLAGEDTKAETDTTTGADAAGTETETPSRADPPGDAVPETDHAPERDHPLEHSPTASEAGDPGTPSPNETTGSPEAGSIDAAAAMGAGTDTEDTPESVEDAPSRASAGKPPSREQETREDRHHTVEEDGPLAVENGSNAEHEDPPDTGDGSTTAGATGDGSTTAGATGDGSTTAGATGDRSTNSGTADDVDRVTVRITEDIGEILGIDERPYTLESEDVVTLPEQNATPLVDRDAAEPLE